jgi:UDP-galactopyranose mutase
MRYGVLVVGAGFAGAVIAERLAAAGNKVLIVEKREHIAGNAYDEIDSNGVLIHRYGPHIFHTNSPIVAEYLSRFTEWRPYEHRVLASVQGVLYPIPINQTTINRLYDLSLDEAGVARFLENARDPKSSIHSSEDLVLNSVGQDLCNKFFRNYTKKQWGLELSELSAGVAARIPVRTNTDDRYFTDTFQKMPSEGYTAMFRRMLENKNIDLQIGVAYEDIIDSGNFDLTVYTGPADAFFKFKYGPLPYRSLRFEHEHLAGVQQLQEVGTVNYPNDFEFTRITEFKHITGQIHSGTSIVREYPTADGDPYYPIPTPANQERYEQYKALAAETKKVVFLGRLAQYRYFNMDQVVAAALKVAESLTGEKVETYGRY